MPVPDLPDLPEPDDNEMAAGRAACRLYVDWVRCLLNRLLYDDEYDDLFVQDLRELAKAAWQEVNGDGLFEVTHGAIRATSEDQLRLHGLYGSQLRFKWRVVAHWLERWRGGALLRDFIDVVDDLLESILSAAGAGGGIKEIKDFIASSTKAELDR